MIVQRIGEQKQSWNLEFLHLWRSSRRNNYETVGPFVIISNAERESESHLELAC